MAASGRSDFWGMQYFLPAESRNHVYKFIATGYILDRFNTFFGVGNDDNNDNPGVATINVPASAVAFTSTELTEEEMYNTVEFNITGKYRLDAIAKRLNIEQTQLEHLNPDFARMMSGPDNSYDLRIPKEKMKQFQADKEEILKESLALMLDDKATSVDKSKFPPPAKLAPTPEAKTAKAKATPAPAPAAKAKAPAAKKKGTAAAKKKATAKKASASKKPTATAKKKTTHKK
jgi:membrane-bound lytic murein transglycosylase D